MHAEFILKNLVVVTHGCLSSVALALYSTTPIPTHESVIAGETIVNVVNSNLLIRSAEPAP